MLPIKLSQEELKQWQNIINNFCNGDKKSRINKKLWYVSQKGGGLGIPNINMYYIANQMRYVPNMIYGLEKMTLGEVELGEKSDKDCFLFIQNKKCFSEIKNPVSNVIVSMFTRNILLCDFTGLNKVTRSYS